MFQHFLNSEHLENTGVLGCDENWPTPKSWGCGNPGGLSWEISWLGEIYLTPSTRAHICSRLAFLSKLRMSPPSAFVGLKAGIEGMATAMSLISRVKPIICLGCWSLQARVSKETVRVWEMTSDMCRTLKFRGKEGNAPVLSKTVKRICSPRGKHRVRASFCTATAALKGAFVWLWVFCTSSAAN